MLFIRDFFPFLYLGDAPVRSDLFKNTDVLSSHDSTNKYSLMNHSKIVGTDFVVNHSNIVEKGSIEERYDFTKADGSVKDSTTTRTIGVFQKYPVGICNPSFTGMYLWELTSTHDLNDYKFCQYHSIKSGVILYGSEAYVFTQITNNDIISHIKILLRGQTFRNLIKLSNAAKLVLNFVRVQSVRTIIPSIEEIQKSLLRMIGISADSDGDNVNTYMTLSYRIYLLMFMLHYKMPIQRKNRPGNRNLSNSVYSF